MNNKHYVIEGDYKVTASAMCPVCAQEVEVSKTIKISKVLAHCFGGDYAGHGKRGDYGPRAKSAMSQLTGLKDGSGFYAQAYTAEGALGALVKMHEESSVWYWGGHGGPGIISMPTPGTMTALASTTAVAATYNKLVTKSNCAIVGGLPKNALKDVFLIVLCGCKTSKSPSSGDSLPTALIKKGADIVIGFDESIYTKSGNRWTRRFFRYLKRGMPIDKSIKRAIAKEKVKDVKSRLNSFRILTSSGATSSATLHPARYGRKTT